jgi:hypothetical protein
MAVSTSLLALEEYLAIVFSHLICWNFFDKFELDLTELLESGRSDRPFCLTHLLVGWSRPWPGHFRLPVAGRLSFFPDPESSQ